MKQRVGSRSPRRAPAVLTFLAVTLLAVMPEGFAAPSSYQRAPSEGRRLELDDIRIRMLVEAEDLGGQELELGELSLPGGTRGAPHTHRTLEIFYVLSGELEHVVNGERFVLGPGRVGIVRPEDRVVHSVPGQQTMRALVIWVPGGAVSELIEEFGFRPVHTHRGIGDRSGVNPEEGRLQ